ncbi:MAG: permease-like cell division protein FtsX [Ndongobacter sp.]|nr:permease-like cell division protein FtsX [Ndongobacter sp.]
MRSFRKLMTVLKQGLKGVWKHKSMGLASIISIVAMLVVVGIILIASLTANNLAKDFEKKVDEVEVFLSTTITDKERRELEELIRSDANVRSVEFRSSAQAMEMMKESWGKDAYILEGIDKEGPVLEPSFVVKVNEIAKAQEFVNRIKAEKGVQDVTYYQDLIDQVSRISRYIRLIGAIMVAGLVLVSLFIILNTVKLTVASRAREISVMKYVGATNHMIRGPFIIEGAIFGLIGSMIAFLLVYYGYQFVYVRFGQRIFELLSAYLLKPELIGRDLMIIFLSIGTGIGLIGSTLTVSRFVKVR